MFKDLLSEVMNPKKLIVFLVMLIIATAALNLLKKQFPVISKITG